MLPPEGFRPKFETSVESRGTILGIISTIVATYWSVLRPGGKLYGENPGQGMLMTGDGDTALFRGARLGQLEFPILARSGRTRRCRASLSPTVRWAMGAGACSSRCVPEHGWSQRWRDAHAGLEGDQPAGHRIRKGTA
jgi:hypothetical protein